MAESLVADTPKSIRLFALLSIRGRLQLSARTGLGWNLPPIHFLRAHFPDVETFPRTYAGQLRFIEDRIESEYGPLENRTTPRKPGAKPKKVAR